MSVQFDNVTLDSTITSKLKGGPRFLTTGISNPTGLAQRNVSRYDAIGRWELEFALLTPTEMEYFIGFFRARFGMAGGFLIQDWTDYQSAQYELLGVGDSSNKDFYLVKNYQTGAAQRRIVKADTAGVKIYLGVGHTLQTITTDYTINADGKVSFVSAPGAGEQVWANFTFLIPVTFGSDDLNLSVDVVTHADLSMPIVEILPIELGISP